MKLPEELINAARNNNLVIFVGAGLSYNLKNKKGEDLKDWNNLVKNAVNNFSQEGYSTMLLENAISRGYTAIDVLDKLEILSKLPANDILGYVKHFYHIINNEEDRWLRENANKLFHKIIPKSKVVEFVEYSYALAENNNWSLHDKLCKLSEVIITTNYDDAFEQTNQHSNRKYKTVLIGDGIPSEKFNNQSSILFKLHGSIAEPNTMVIFPYDYAHLYEHTSHEIISYFNKLLINKSILFIGCGMGDWQINNIFLKTKELLADISQSHFIITPQKKFNEKLKGLKFLTPIFVTDFDVDTKKYWEDINDIVEYLLYEKINAVPEMKVNYFEKGNELFNMAVVLNDEELWKECCEQYGKAATELDLRNETLFYNWGTALLCWAKLKKSETLYLKSIEKLKIARQLNQNEEKIALQLQIANNNLWQLDVDSIIKEYYNKKSTMIPVKVCPNCFCINSCDKLTCKRCGKELGKEWLDYGHFSGGICEKCSKYAGIAGDGVCPICGNKVPSIYEDFFDENFNTL
jgi:hypothetical protein